MAKTQEQIERVAVSAAPQVAFSHRVWPQTLAPCAAIRRPERCRHVRIKFSAGAR